MRPVASDWDGTYNVKPELAGKVDIIITGNSWTEFDRIQEEFGSGTKLPVFFNPEKADGDVMQIVAHKANIINKTNAKKYFEDQPIQVQLLTALCDKCEIILVKENQFVL